MSLESSRTGYFSVTHCRDLEDFREWMNSTGSFQPDVIVDRACGKNFESVGESVEALKAAIEFLTTSPSLPVAFDCCRAVNTLASQLHKQTTLSLVARIAGKSPDTDDLLALTRSLAIEGCIEGLEVVLRNHLGELRPKMDLVKEVVAIFPFAKESEIRFQTVVRDIVMPGLSGGLCELAVVLVERSKEAGRRNEGKLGLSGLAIVTSTDWISSPTPLEDIRCNILLSERNEVEETIRPTRELLELLVLASERFGINSLSFSDLERDRNLALENVGSEFLVNTGNLGAFCEYCDTFQVDRDKLLSVQVMAVKEQILCGEKSTAKKPRTTEEHEDGILEVLYSLICEINSIDIKSDCLYAALSAVHSLNLFPESGKDRFESLAKEVAQSGSLLELYLSIRSVQTCLERFDRFSFIRNRPDFLMKRENVLLVATELALMGEVETVHVLASTFPYIDRDEMVLTRLSILSTDVENIPEILPLLSQGNLVDRFVDTLLGEDFNSISHQICAALLSDSAIHSMLCLKKKKHIGQLTVLLLDFNKQERGRNLPQYLEADESVFQNLLTDSEDSVECEAKLQRARVAFDLLSYREEDYVLSRVDALVEQVTMMELGNVNRPMLESILLEAHDLMLSIPTGDYRVTTLVEEVFSPIQSFLFSSSPADVADYSDSLMLIHDIKSRGRNPPLDFTSLNMYHNVMDFIHAVSLSDLLPDKIDDSLASDPSSASRDCPRSTLSSRVKWGALFERLSIPFNRETLLQSVDASDSVHKSNVKKILNECFPSLAVKSKFDVELLKSFGKDFGRSEVDVLVKLLEIALEPPHCNFEVCKCVLIELVNQNAMDKLATYTLPCLSNDPSIRWLVSNVLELSEGESWSRLAQVIALVDSSHVAISDGVIRTLVSSPAKVAVDLLTKQLRSANEEVEYECLIKLGLLVLDIATRFNFVAEAVKRIVAYPDLIYQTNIQRLISVIDRFFVDQNQQQTMVVRELLQALPLSNEQLMLAVHYKGILNISETDLKLLENRLVLKKFKISESVETKMKEFNFSLKRIVEYIYGFGEFDQCDQLVEELIHVNGADGVKIRIDIAKKWIAEDPAVSRDKLIALLKPVCSNHDQEVVITPILKLYFNPKTELGNRIVCFEVLFKLFTKSAILAVYNNPIEDLVEIQKNLVYMHLLTERNKVMRPMEYKDFVSLDKALVAKNLIATNNKDFVILGSAVVGDFRLNDFQLVERLEERVKIVANNSLGVVRDRMRRAGIWTSLSCLSATDENKMIN